MRSTSRPLAEWFASRSAVGDPDWGHVAMDFLPRLTRLLTATAIGLVQSG